MKKVGQAAIEVVCDLSLELAEVKNNGPQFWSSHAHWGYGARHDGKRHRSTRIACWRLL
jgi:hypothetical protein